MRISIKKLSMLGLKTTEESWSTGFPPLLAKTLSHQPDGRSKVKIEAVKNGLSRERLDIAAILTRLKPGELRDYHCPNTKVAFVEGERDPGTRIVKIYHDAITSEKSWVVLPGVSHGVAGDPIGAATIQEALLEALRLVEDRPD